MKEFNRIPTSISHKQLNSLLLRAHKEVTEYTDESNEVSEEQEKFNHLAHSWFESSKKILNSLQKDKEHLGQGKCANYLMALGAMEAHINMAMQAFKASELD